MNGGECFLEDEVNQAEPEYSQPSYLRLRSLEEVFEIKNYMDPKCNDSLASFVKNSGKESSVITTI